MNNTRFIFVRHGETDANIAGFLQGQYESNLTPNGIAQAQAVAEALKNEHFSHIYASDLRRAVMTAQIIQQCGHTDTPLTITPALREWNCGDIEGIGWDELGAKYPDLAKAFAYESGNLRFPGGENRMEFQQRIADLLEDARKRHLGETVLIVSHGGVLQRIFRHICGVISDENLLPLCDNASISLFCFNELRQAWQLTAWNRTAHLQHLPLHTTFVL